MTIIIEDDFLVANKKSVQGITNRDVQSRTSSALGEMERKLYFSNNFKGEETGLFHPSYSSVIKMNNAGDIELFTENNTGISIDRRLEIISTYANATKEHLHESHRWLSGNDLEYIKGQKEVHVAGRILIDGDDNLELKIDKDILASGRNLTLVVGNNINLEVAGNVNANVKGHAKIEVAGALQVESKSNVDINTAKDIRLNGNRVLVKGKDVEQLFINMHHH